MPTFDANNLGAFEKWLKQSLKKSVRTGNVSSAYKGVQMIMTKLIPKAMPYPPVDKGIYRAAWRVDMSSPSGDIEIVNNAPHAVFIEEGVRAGNVKIGRKMIAALSEWAKRHPGKNAPPPPPVEKPKAATPQKNEPKKEQSGFAKAFNKLIKNLASFIKRNRIGANTRTETGGDGGKKTTVEPMTDRAALNAAWAIAMAMKERGIFKGTGLKIAQKAAEELRAIVAKEVAKQITKDFG